jgi:hypothetical protein
MMALGHSFLEIIVAIVVPLVTAAGVFLGPYLAETLRRRHERHREQLLEFKRYVLARLRGLLEEHYLAILRNERPVSVFSRKTFPGRKFTWASGRKSQRNPSR